MDFSVKMKTTQCAKLNITDGSETDDPFSLIPIYNLYRFVIYTPINGNQKFCR